MHRILVRFNTKYMNDPKGRRWRVLVNGEEHLAHKVHINVPCQTLTEPIASGEIKDHFLCMGFVSFEGNHEARIITNFSIDDLKNKAMQYNTASVLEQIEFSDPHYFRKQVYVDDLLEIVLVCFKKGQATSVHDHGESNCVMRCLQGSVSECQYNSSNHSQQHVYCKVAEGELNSVPPMVAHKVACEEDSVLLNFYSPPLKISSF